MVKIRLRVVENNVEKWKSTGAEWIEPVEKLVENGDNPL